MRNVCLTDLTLESCDILHNDETDLKIFQSVPLSRKGKEIVTACI
jgi:hypothetical protein